MADLIRSAKSSGDWTRNELMAYNIVISPLLPDNFFPTPDPSLDEIDPAILDSPLYDTNLALSDAAAEYLGYLGLATRPTQESFIDSFAIETLKLLGFNGRDTIVSMHHIIPLTICGVDRVAQADVCLIHNRGFVLLVLIRDKKFVDSEARVVAEAIAAFQFNNAMREEYGLGPLDAMTIPCITMSGTRPTFYLVPVTAELSAAVTYGQYPKNKTQVSRCVTTTTRMHASLGMGDLEYRKLVLKRFLSFKELVKGQQVHIWKG